MKNKIYILAILLTAILLPGISRGANLNVKKHREVFALMGYYTPERVKALKTLGLDDRQINRYYTLIDIYFSEALDVFDPDDEIRKAASYVQRAQLFSVFGREQYWTLAIDMDEATLDDMGSYFMEWPWNVLSYILGVIEYHVLDITIFNLQEIKGVDALFSQRVPEDSYCEKVKTLMFLIGEDEIFKLRMQSYVKRNGYYVDDKDLDTYTKEGNYAYRMSCVLQDYITEDQLDELIYLYSTPEGINLSRCRINKAIPYILQYGDPDKDMESTYNEEVDAVLNISGSNLWKDAYRLQSYQSMRDFQAAWEIVETVSNAIMCSDIEETILGLNPGTIVSFDDSVLIQDIEELLEIQKIILELKYAN